jgi:hypothetical protein
VGSGLLFTILKMLQFSSNFTSFIAVVHERKKTLKLTNQPKELTLARAPSCWTEDPIASERTRDQNAIISNRNKLLGWN